MNLVEEIPSNFDMFVTKTGMNLLLQWRPSICVEACKNYKIALYLLLIVF